MWSQKKKKKVIALTEASFSPLLCWSPKKKKGPLSEFCEFSPWFVRHTRARRRVPQLSMIFGAKQKRRFLAGEKTPEFAKFQCKNAGKNFALFALFCAYREHCWAPYDHSGTNEAYLCQCSFEVSVRYLHPSNLIFSKLPYWDNAWACNTLDAVCEFWQMIDLLVTSKQ